KEFAVNVPDDTEVINNIIDETEGKGILKVEPEEQQSVFVTFFTMMFPFLIIGLIFFFIFSRSQGGGGGGRVMNFGKSKAKLYNEEKTKVRFPDVAGQMKKSKNLLKSLIF